MVRLFEEILPAFGYTSALGRPLRPPLLWTTSSEATLVLGYLANHCCLALPTHKSSSVTSSVIVVKSSAQPHVLHHVPHRVRHDVGHWQPRALHRYLDGRRKFTTIWKVDICERE